MSAIDTPEAFSSAGLEPEDDGPSIGLTDLLLWLGDGKRWVAGATAVAAVGAVVVALLTPNVYTARSTFLAPGSQQQSGSAAALAALGSLGGLAGSISAKSPDELYVSLLKSESVQRGLASRFNLMQRYEAKTFDALRKAMAANIRVSSDKKSGVLTVEVDDKDPQFSAELANAHAPEVARLLSRLAVSEAQQRRVFFELQLKDTKENLIQAEQTLRTVQEKSGMVVLDKQAEAIIAGVAQLKAQIAEREVRLRVMRTGATAENPDVQRLNSELAGLRAELARMESAPSGPATGSIDIPVGKLPAAAVDYIRARREVKFQETLLESMLRQFEIAKLDEAKEGPALQPVDVAQPPDRKSKPARAVIVLTTTLLAFIGASLLVVWRRYRSLTQAHDPARAAAWQAIRQAWRWRRA
jgi:capsule polysaccharide export protein KpsE/RkpR